MKSLEESMETYNAYANKANKLQGELEAGRTAMQRAFKEAEAELPPLPVAPKTPIDIGHYEYRKQSLISEENNARLSICPTCKRPFDEAGTKAAAEVVRQTKEWLAEHADEYRATVAYNEACIVYERAVQVQKAAQERAANAQSLVMDAMDALDALVPVENPKDKWNAAYEAYRTADSNLNRVKRLLVEADTTLQHMRTALANQEEQQRQWAEREAEVTRLEHEILVNGQTELLMKQYKNALIASVIPTITERASALITEMTEGKYTELHLTPQYDIEYKPTDQEELKSFANLSGGEKDVFALALRLAIADLKAGSIGVLVLDEVLDSLDAGRQEATWAALERLTNRYNQIFVITHVDSFKDRAPHTIQV
jgi:DNA repair exonuclease SbcCD ATPase subunit